MFKFIIFILIVLMIIGSGDVFKSYSQGDFWFVQINHQELLTSIVDGFNIVYDAIVELFNTNTNKQTMPV